MHTDSFRIPSFMFFGWAIAVTLSLTMLNMAVAEEADVVCGPEFAPSQDFLAFVDVENSPDWPQQYSVSVPHQYRGESLARIGILFQDSADEEGYFNLAWEEEADQRLVHFALGIDMHSVLVVGYYGGSVCQHEGVIKIET
ncbi:hypothetical protein BST95_02585 [Halioglobus japonicus]|uniref:Uncharacterized protein n=2 Tax=Halioglobus japonicus TaxID=930805 RepID=A0AAP8MBB0_9GAMM|nr:hypothetical protein [Halioglobus japonicus]AQA17274.1 hypothetical protein BST95_02585 [Halioglobus japonicus]PLW84514.1 hypothetical protein C0029_18865 [Halioglobus japonicus]GHD24542.1 hypothetical protein GCM10007052_38210 [Halioglobus japonicus]